MSEDWISFDEALTYVEARNVPKPASRLWDVIRRKRIKASFPGDKDDDSNADAWTDYHLNTRAAFMREADRNALTRVYLPSLMEWLNRLSGQAAASPTKNGRKPGTGMNKTDAPYVEMMRELITSKKANSRSHAVKLLIKQHPELVATAEDASVIRRLRESYTGKYGE